MSLPPSSVVCVVSSSTLKQQKTLAIRYIFIILRGDTSKKTLIACTLISGFVGVKSPVVAPAMSDPVIFSAVMQSCALRSICSVLFRPNQSH
jgi:hypothetical protein